MFVYPFCFPHSAGFNPRTHTGCDFLAVGLLPNTGFFQSTHPHWVRHIGANDDAFVLQIQSTHPHEVRQPSMRPKSRHRGVQSTHPHGVRLMTSKRLTALMLFQSTHPHGVRRDFIKRVIEPSSFNPRTHTGCDCIFSKCLNINLNR